jgi:N,N'-diacetyllegionaminate synthase
MTSELGNLDIIRKSIVARKNIIRGEVFTSENLTTKRPGNGISPMQWDNLIGKVSKRDYLPDELVEL